MYFNFCRVSACRWAPASKTRWGNDGQSCVLALFCSLFHFYIILILTSSLIDGCKKYWITVVQFIIHILYSPSFDISNLFDPLLLLLFLRPPPLSAVRPPLSVDLFSSSICGFRRRPVCSCVVVCLPLFFLVSLYVCDGGLWSVSAGHQPVCVEWAGGIGDRTEAHRQQSCSGGETTAKPHGNRWVT